MSGSLSGAADGGQGARKSFLRIEGGASALAHPTICGTGLRKTGNSA
jgi:hypothetical protein